MNDNLSNQLAILAAKLNVSVDALYIALRKQALLDGLSIIFLYAVLAFCGYILFRWGRKIQKKVSERYDDGGEGFAWVMLASLWGFAVLLCICFLPNTLAAFLNPDYWALHQILSLGRK